MLVTIVVVTYNSAKYVIDTLDSVYSQHYNKIELIVSDDCSTDSTIDICQKWIDGHRQRFVSAFVTQTKQNSGICANYNHALSMSNGDWIKFIAGDDRLKPDCINTCLSLSKTEHSYFVAGGAEVIDERGAVTGDIKCILPNCSVRKQLLMMLQHYDIGIQGASLFLNKTKLVELGGFDTRFPMSEDYQIVMRFLTHGYPITIADMPYVQWRNYSTSVSKSHSKFSDSYFGSRWHYARFYCLKYGLFLRWYHEFVFHYLRTYSNRNIVFKFIGYFFRIFDIYHWRDKQKSHV